MSRYTTQAFQKTWLKFAAIMIAGLGPLFFLGSMDTPLNPLPGALAIVGGWAEGADAAPGGDLRLLSAILGGVLFGWGVMVWCLAIWVFDAAPEGVRKSFLIALIAWFVLDSAGSVLSGHSLNVLYNALYLMVVVGPLWRPAHRNVAGA